MKFQHRGAYEDIDATYEAITAYLDEKNIEAQNLFVEEYLTDPKAPDDASLEVDIYVFIKG
jgi:effector-binding domain-containing protein